MTAPLVYTPLDDIAKIRRHLRETFMSGKTKSIEFRKGQLLQLAYLIQDNVEPFQIALRKDLGRPALESNMSDLSAMIGEALYAYENIKLWTKPEQAPFNLNFFPFSPKIYKEAKGIVLIISPFNYPLWCMTPFAGAIAAGCAVVLKPSELTPATSQLFAELLPKYLDQDLYSVVNGAVEETTNLLSLQWDHILYTGGSRVGRIVASAAAKHLTPTTLELGGKSPVIVDENADFELAARRILWGRMSNAGQTCVAPDYVLVLGNVEQKFTSAIKGQYTKFYGNDAPLLKDTQGEILLGGDVDKSTKYIAPTIVTNVTASDSLMKELLFGPILPIIAVPDLHAAIRYLNGQDAPLALYVFSKDKKVREYVRENTLSGMFMENDVLLLAGSPVTPFGGVRQSGYGAHHGKYSFDTFTHLRTSLSSPSWIDLILGMRYPPYTAKKLKQLNALTMPPIPYSRPGEKKEFNWKLWGAAALASVLIAANWERIIYLIAKKRILAKSK